MILQELQEVIAKAGGVVAFQAAHKLVADGVPGPKTYNAALRSLLGLQPLVLPGAGVAKDGIRRPGLDQVYGEFSFEHLPADKIKEKKDKGRVVLDPAWIAANIIEKKCWDGQVLKFHKDVADEFDWLFKKAVKESGYHPAWTVGFKPRHTMWDPARSLSTHSWGCAVDFDPARNDLGGVDAEKGGPSLMRKNPKFYEVFKAGGWAWLGEIGIRDDMHMQRTTM